MAAADIFVFPSYREGFGSVVIEAAACGLLTVASRTYGLTDAVVEGTTGLLHPRRHRGLARSAGTFVQRRDTAWQHGRKGPRACECQFLDGIDKHAYARILRTCFRASLTASSLARVGARQGNCRLDHAICVRLSCPKIAASMTESRSGFNVTAPRGVKSRVAPDQRRGLAV